MLERRGDQVHVEALLDEHFGQDAEARVAARLVAELDAHGDHGDAGARARLGALCVGLRIHASKYTKPAPRSARRTANPHEPRRIRARCARGACRFARRCRPRWRERRRVDSSEVALKLRSDCAETPSQARRGPRIAGASGPGRGDGGLPGKRHPCAWPELRLLLEVAHSRVQKGLLAPVASYPTK